ncbi:putative cytochrome b561 [Cupriavidus gilardii CR3]|uniref:Cytochrome b n=1 Tax=Cupriavidus gilardii TaxID=82541 RepID=A0A849BKX6_9BURK|nr:cytochrome b [Cupriavidus gilardii]ALD91516.1 putative cytochrome b561 [Cupriavidus gilardii CR3]KAB0598104.1 cytochrome b [Cupriavidus gilardii]MCT9012720.1 cytochrome b [Cupriavidus gilardii]MCT9054686.1 cytochrome b [Cupriavidus gilardii]NNH11229.1 cytochrome b [Cupriavidus gilardii]
MRSNTPARYSATAIGLHWIVALLIFAAFGLGLYMTDIPGFTPTKLKLYSWHKWLGVTVFALAVLRVLWRLTHAAPAPVAGMPAWQAAAAKAAHGLLYLLILAVPVTGYLYSQAAGVPVVYLGVWPLPQLIEPNDALKETLKFAHIWLNYLMAAIVVLHAAAALKHHWLDRDGTLGRMLPFLR